MSTSIRSVFFLAAGLVALAASATAEAQVVYYGAMRPVVVAAPVMAAPVMAAPVMAPPAYVSNYTPAGNYAAVTAFSPPSTRRRRKLPSAPPTPRSSQRRWR